MEYSVSIIHTFVAHQHLQDLFTFSLTEEMISNPSYFAGTARVPNLSPLSSIQKTLASRYYFESGY